MSPRNFLGGELSRWSDAKFEVAGAQCDLRQEQQREKREDIREKRAEGKASSEPKTVAKDFFGSSAQGGMAPKRFGPAPTTAYLQWILTRRGGAVGGPRDTQSSPPKNVQDRPSQKNIFQTKIQRRPDAGTLCFTGDPDAPFRIHRAYAVAMALTEIGGDPAGRRTTYFGRRGPWGAHFARSGQNNTPHSKRI